METGAIIAMLRKELKLTQKEFGVLVNLSSSTISNYENGENNPDLVTLRKMADIFGVTTDFILGRSSYRCSPELLDKYISADMTVCDLTDTILNLNPKSQDAAAKYIAFLANSNEETPEQ